MTEPRPLSEWKTMGLRTTANAALPKSQMPASLAVAGTRTFLLYNNYEALLGYNCAHSYALSVGLLADRPGEIGTRVATSPPEVDMDRDTERVFVDESP